MTIRCLVTAALVAVSACDASAAWPAPRPLDGARLAAAGVRLVETTHATLVTDAPPSPATDALPGLIDSAVPQWAERFGVGEARRADWRLRVYLVEDEAKFRALGLWPAESPEFPHGLSLGYEVWLRQQAADYYRRHLLLHEGTHSFMTTLLGSCGPGWYMEGMAELCGTHAAEGRSLRLAVVPPTRGAARDWGRIALVRDDAERGRLLPVEAVMRIDNRAVLSTESYAWVWALAAFLDGHPAYRDRFREASGWVTSPRFDRRFRTMYERDRRRLDQEWRLFAATLDYGHDLEREAIDFREGAPLAAGGSRRIAVRADRGWQSSAVRVEAGQPIRLSSAGRFVVGREEGGAPWPCEGGGVTLDYHAGRPLGELLATVDAGAEAFVTPKPIGLAADYTPPATGTLYLRVNDAPNALADNEGELRVTISNRP